MPASIAPEPLYDGKQSVSGKAWAVRPYDHRLAEALVTQKSIARPVARLLSARGINLDSVDTFLAPTLRDTMPNPATMQDVDKAVARIITALDAGETIAVFGDYDVDGATSSALLIHVLGGLGANVVSYIPDRQREGYGPSVAAMQQLADEGAGLIITVDCGTLSYGPVDAANQAGADVIILDHHKAEPQLPAAAAVVNPNRLDDDSGLGHLAAVGVCFMVMAHLLSALRARDDTPAVNLLALLDMVALGTVCDMVPLVGLNRTLVAQGLKVMAKRQNIGLTALADVSRISEAPSAYHLGFLLGPRVNAGGRVGESSLGTTLLTTPDRAKAKQIAETLDRLNEERRAIEAEVQEAAMVQAEAQLAGNPDCPVLVVASAKWHAGVIGIVAGRLKDRFGLPAIVISLDGDEGKGSVRSIPDVDMGAAILKAVDAGALMKGGGHAMAAGLTIAADQIDGFTTFIWDLQAEDVRAAKTGAVMALDAALDLGGATVALTEQLDQLGPFGMGNATPKYLFEDVRLVKADIVGGAHIRAIVQGGSGGGIKAMAFRSVDTPIGEALLSNIGQKITLAARIKKDDWGYSPKVELLIEDIMLDAL